MWIEFADSSCGKSIYRGGSVALVQVAKINLCAKWMMLDRREVQLKQVLKAEGCAS